jgi:hypothetical protein
VTLHVEYEFALAADDGLRDLQVERGLGSISQ